MGLATRRTHVVAAFLAVLPLSGSGLLAAAAPAAAQGGGPEVQATNDNKFLPPTINVPVGGTVTWTAPAGSFHTVTGGKDGQKDPASPMNGPIGFTTYTAKFDKAGTFPYYCEPHLSLGMVGEVIVGGAGATSPTPTAGASNQPAQTSSPTPVGSPATSPGEEIPHGAEIPGVKDNKALERIEAQRAAQKGTIGGFRAFTMAGTAAILALAIAVFASTRPRRGTPN